MTRLSTSRLVKLADELADRDRAILDAVGRFRLLSGRQLERLFWSGPAGPTRARLARRGMARLERLRLLQRLERQVGGVRAGSAGSVFTLSASGQRMRALLAGVGITAARTPYEPGGQYVRHTLAVAEMYVLLNEAQGRGELELLAFAAEPECWRPYVNRAGSRLTLKPDAFSVLGVGAYEDRYFLEIDCGTEGRGTLARKASAYIDYFRTGTEQHEHAVFPKVLWSVSSERRKSLLVDVCTGLPTDSWQLFAVTTHDQAIALIRAGVGGGS